MHGAIYFLESGKQKINEIKIDEKNEHGRWKHEFPRYDLLIDIAIEEKDSKRVLELYDSLPNEFSIGLPYSRVARAIEREFPERSLEIWKYLAESEIARTKR